jgi:hypothetical protein
MRRAGRPRVEGMIVLSVLLAVYLTKPGADALQLFIWQLVFEGYARLVACFLNHRIYKHRGVSDYQSGLFQEQTEYVESKRKGIEGSRANILTHVCISSNVDLPS